MKKQLIFIFMCACISLLQTVARAQDTVVIIRHGEKPADGDNLCPKGQSRALALPAVLSSMFSIPLYTYVPKIGTGAAQTTSVRMFETVTPFAIANNLQVGSEYSESDIPGITGKIKEKLGHKSKHGVILLVWEHKNIPPIAAALKVQGKLSWEKCDFDSIWIITNPFTSSATLTIAQEGLNGVGGACSLCQ